MMQMIRALDTILLRASQAELTPSADATRESDPNISTDFDVFIHTWAELDDASYALMTAYVRELDLGDWFSIRAGCDACLCVKICRSYALLIQLTASGEGRQSCFHTALTDTSVENFG